MPPKEVFAYPFLTRKMLAFEQGAAFSLLVHVVAHDTEAWELRGFTKEGPFTFRFLPVGDASLETFIFNIPDTPIHLSLFPGIDANASAYCYGVVHLRVNASRTYLLAQGACSFLHGICWPEQPVGNPFQLEGTIVAPAGAVPAAGAEATFTVPDNQVFEVLGVWIELTTSSTASDRTVAIIIEENSNLLSRNVAGTTQQASETQGYSFVPDGVTGVIVADESQEIKIRRGIILRPGSTLTTSTTNIQVADQFTALRILVRRWYQPA